ncbi:MAG: glycine--tRNA ligase subunit alpha [Ardenticatenaceae bacterium]|nr:glycine--tRNA ligase subunit alpha [Ardenticatenaceae bacterium]
MVALLAFWQEYGCLDAAVQRQGLGQGTMNPATALRVLRPEPWNVVYVEPIFAPMTAFRGQPPTASGNAPPTASHLAARSQQSRTLLKKSLEAVGIVPPPTFVLSKTTGKPSALGAWGLGSGSMARAAREITQFTYFQQAGGQTLDPVAVELTYGLDRIALALQGKNSVWEIGGTGIPWRHPAAKRR